MSEFEALWSKFANSKEYREHFVAAQVKRGIPLQVRQLLRDQDISQSELAERAKLTQGVVSRAADPDYGNLTLNTIIRIAAGFDVAFVGKFVPFSALGHWFLDRSENDHVEPFSEEDARIMRQDYLPNASITPTGSHPNFSWGSIPESYLYNPPNTPPPLEVGSNQAMPIIPKRPAGFESASATGMTSSGGNMTETGNTIWRNDGWATGNQTLGELLHA